MTLMILSITQMSWMSPSSLMMTGDSNDSSHDSNDYNYDSDSFNYYSH